MSGSVRAPWLSTLSRLGVLLVLAAGVALVIANREAISPAAVQAWVGRAGILAPLLFMALFSLSALLFIPATVMVLAGGALFGPWLGAFYNVTGATLGAVLAFLISRYLAHDWAQRKAGGLLRVIMTGVRDEGWKFVLFIRLAGFPYFLLNYVLGLTPIRVGHYAFASYLGLAPSMAAITYAGHVGFEALSGGEGVIGKLMLAIALVGLAALVPVVIRILKRRRTPAAAGEGSDIVP